MAEDSSDTNEEGQLEGDVKKKLAAIFAVFVLGILALVLAIMAIGVVAYLGGNLTGGGNTSGLCANVPEPYNAVFRAAGEKWKVQPAFIAAIFYGGEHNNSWPAASGPWKTSESGAQGPFQFKPGTWSTQSQFARPNPENASGTPDVQNLYDSAFAAAHLSAMNGAGGNTTDLDKLRDAASLYNSGKHWSEGAGMPKVADYVSDVIAAYQSFLCQTSGGACGDQVATLAKNAVGNPSTMYYSNHDLACAAFTSSILVEAGALSKKELSAENMWSKLGGQIIIPRGSPLDLNKLVPGDVVFWDGYRDNGSKMDHVGIYIGNDQVVNNSSTEAHIVNSKLSTWMGGHYFAGAKRFCQQASTSSAGKTVVIDAGHISEIGSGTRNAATGITELQVNWDVAVKVESILKAKGVKVVLTKSSVNQTVTNKNRAEIANASNAALFFRIHANTGSAKGFFIEYPTKVGTAPDGTRGPPAETLAPAKKAVDLIAAKVQSATGLSNLGSRSEESSPTAAQNGGVLIGSVYSKVPTATIEMIGMSDSADNARWIANAANQQKMAQGIADGIIEFLK